MKYRYLCFYAKFLGDVSGHFFRVFGSPKTHNKVNNRSGRGEGRVPINDGDISASIGKFPSKPITYAAISSSDNDALL
jgi:hypothetical protein